MPETKSKLPTHTVRQLPAPGAAKAPWPFVGVAWLNSDASINISLEQDLPAGTRIQLKARKPKAGKPASEAKASKGGDSASQPTP